MLKTSKKRKNSSKVKRYGVPCIKGKPYEIIEAWQSVNNPSAPLLVIVKPLEKEH